MTNFEYFKDDILEMCEEKKLPAISDGKLAKCIDITCDLCDLQGGCTIKLIKWLYSEHDSDKLERLDPKIMGIIGNENYILTASEIRSIFEEAYRTQPKTLDAKITLSDGEEIKFNVQV